MSKVKEVIFILKLKNLSKKMVYAQKKQLVLKCVHVLTGRSLFDKMELIKISTEDELVWMEPDFFCKKAGIETGCFLGKVVMTR